MAREGEKLPTSASNTSKGRTLTQTPSAPTATTDEITQKLQSEKKEYRAGFVDAFFGGYDLDSPQAIRRAKRLNVLHPSNELFHYTSLAGLKGIIEENGFWISDNRFMNDAEESWNGIKLARKVVQHRAKRSQDPRFSIILQQADELLASPRMEGNLIACFSTRRDDLGQWRGYGAGGVCLCLGEAKEGESSLFFGPEHMPHKAEYDDLRKAMMLLTVVQEFELQYAIDRDVMTNHWPSDHDENYKKELVARVSGFIASFKDRAFENEAEARIVLSYEHAKCFDGGLKFRVNPLGIIPYLRTGDNLAIKKNGGRLPLREVIVGPAPHQELIAQSLETFLKHKGYKKTTVSLSRVPYRAN